MRTIIVRAFEPVPGRGWSDLRGFVEDVATGSRERFVGAEELVAAVARILRRAELTGEGNGSGA
jgi:hypothetical protein